MKKRIINFNVFIFLLFCSGVLLAQPTITRKKINFDRDWKFQFGHASDPTKDFNYKIANLLSKTGQSEGTAIDPRFDDHNWRSLNLPHDWVVELPFENSPNKDVKSHGYKPVGGLYPQNSIGWYRKSFVIAQADSGQRFAIQFDGIYRDAKVWINGFYLGTNESGYVGVNYDITDFINYGKTNVIVVRVDATQFEGWFYEGSGIYRHVWLEEYDNLHIAHDGIFVSSEVHGNSAKVSIETTLDNQILAPAVCQVMNIIMDRNGKKIGESIDQTISLALNEHHQVKQTIEIASPRVWSLEDPYMYTVVTRIKTSHGILDQVLTKFGIRSFEFDVARGLILNGKPIKIKGVNCHQDHAGVGIALPDYLQYYRIRQLKKLGANAYRTSHYAPTPELLEACDSLGMLVLDETRLLNSGPEYRSQFERQILRDRNHPSIFLWSIGNEEGYVQRTSTGKRMALSSIAKLKELDPTRRCTYAADVGNVFTGINEIIPVRGFNYRVSGIQPYHAEHPDQPVLGTEMGSTVTTRGEYVTDTVNGYVPDEDLTSPRWGNKAEEWWPLAAVNPWMMGGFVWTGFDYRGEPTPYQWPDINSNFGVMDMCGFPKNIYYYYQSWWTDQDVLHISPHWNWQGKEGQPINVWVNSNAEEVELFLNGKTQGKKTMKVNSHLEWNIPFEPGILQAIAFKNGRQMTAKVETSGRPFQLVVTPSKTTIIADGNDVTIVNITAIDSLGREVPDAQNLVTFLLTGEANIIGVGNGNPNSHEPDKCMDGPWQRKLFNGKCQVIIQSGTKNDIIKLEARSEHLYSASTEIHSIQPVSTTNSSVPSNKPVKEKQVDKMIGADISFLPQLEDRGMKFYDQGIEKDVFEILKDHGFNAIRLRIFNHPENEKGYSPGKGFCDLEHTKAMAIRIKKAGMKFLLDFHYSDYWADPQQQNKPLSWKDQDFNTLKASLKDYTKTVLLALKEQGTLPDMVQVGNEINHGILWPEGHISHIDSLAGLIKAGIEGIKETDPSIVIMLHIALGGQNDEAVFWLNNMFARGVDCDVIGLSYYPRWHGTLDDLKDNLEDLVLRYHKYVNVVEYSQRKGEVNDIVFSLENHMGTGSFIWEPLSTWESVFDKKGHANQSLSLYDNISHKYLR